MRMMKISRPALGALAIGLAFSAVPAQAQSMTMTSPNAIQPETTLSINASAIVAAEPDVAYLTGGVVSEALTANEALRKNATNMAGVYAALEKAGLERKNIQTSNFSLQPKYTYPENAERILSGYTVSNQVTAKVTRLDDVGDLIDAMVAQGGNSFDGVRFDLLDSSEIMNEARRKAMTEAIERAKLYAQVSGYEVARIVTISESGGFTSQPRPQMVARMSAMESAPTQISGGELSYSSDVSVVFELKK